MSLHRRARITRSALVDVESGPLEVRKKGRGDTIKERIPTSPLACRAIDGSIKQAHRGATSAVSSSQGAALIGTRVQGKELGSARPVRKDGGTEALEQETRGGVRPGSTNSPSSTGKGSAHSPSLASEGGAQIERDVGFARGTRIAKVGSVARGAKGRRCVVFGGPKGHRATGDAHRRRLQVAQLVEHRSLKPTVVGSNPACLNAKTSPVSVESGVSLGSAI